MAMVLMGIFRVAAEDEIRLYFFDNTFDLSDKLDIHNEMSILVTAPEDTLGSQNGF